MACPRGEGVPIIANNVPVHHGLVPLGMADAGPIAVGPVINEPVASESKIYAQPIVRTMPMMIPRKTPMVCSLPGARCLGQEHKAEMCRRFPQRDCDMAAYWAMGG